MEEINTNTKSEEIQHIDLLQEFKPTDY